MSGVLIIALGVVVWLCLCLIFLGMCVSAKEGDDEQAADAGASSPRRAPALS